MRTGNTRSKGPAIRLGRAAGFALAPAATVGAVLSPFAGRLVDRVGHRELVTVGCLCGAAGTLWWGVAVTKDADDVTAVLPGMLLAGWASRPGSSP